MPSIHSVSRLHLCTSRTPLIKPRIPVIYVMGEEPLLNLLAFPLLILMIYNHGVKSFGNLNDFLIVLGRIFANDHSILSSEVIPLSTVELVYDVCHGELRKPQKFCLTCLSYTLVTNTFKSTMIYAKVCVHVCTQGFC